MECLPFEIQDSVLQHLDSLSDLKAVRLLNKRYHDLATPHVYRCVLLTVEITSFVRLHQISASPLSQHVRCLHYNIWAIPLIPKREWADALRRLRRASKNGHHDNFPQYRQYRRYYEDQVLCDFSLLKEAFRRLPALRSLEISEFQPPQLTQAGVLTNLSRIAEAAAYPPEYVPSSRATEVSCKISRALTIISAHGAATSRPLENLTLIGFRWHWLDACEVRMWHGSPILHEALRGLKRLRISVADPASDPTDADIPDLGAAVEVWKNLIGKADGLDVIEAEIGGG